MLIYFLRWSDESNLLDKWKNILSLYLTGISILFLSSLIDEKNHPKWVQHELSSGLFLDSKLWQCDR